MQARRTRLEALARKLGVSNPQQLGAQLALLINGALVSTGLLKLEQATEVLTAAAQVLCNAQASLFLRRFFLLPSREVHEVHAKPLRDPAEWPSLFRALMKSMGPRVRADDDIASQQD